MNERIDPIIDNPFIPKIRCTHQKMAFDWLNKFQKAQEKAPNYAEKTLAAYKLGMKAKGSIAGVRIATSPQSCPQAHALDASAIYHPDDAPRLPLSACPLATTCQCVYRPVMSYEVEERQT